jgi:hypothetical protein
MKKTLVALIAGLLVAVASPAMAVYVLLEPESSTVGLGQLFDVDLCATLGAGEYVDWYDIDVTFEPDELGFTGYALGDGLGDVTDDYSTDWGIPGLANVAQYSWSDLGNQAGKILLATLTFEALALGKTSLGFDFVEVKHGTYQYEEGWDLTQTGTQVDVVPIPAAVWLLGTGLLGLVGLRKRMK